MKTSYIIASKETKNKKINKTDKNNWTGSLSNSNCYTYALLNSLAAARLLLIYHSWPGAGSF
jgi:hypothetical protein